MQAGEEMITNAISKLIIDFCNDMLAGMGGVYTGQLNDSENYIGEQVAIFAVAAHSIDPTQDPVILEEVEKTKQVYIWGMKFFGLLLTAFLLFQQMWPSKASEMVGTFRGQPGYVTVDEMAEYYIIVGLWFILGPALLYGSLYLNNDFTQSLTLSSLDHVTFSSENVGFFAIMTGLWTVMSGFFATRIVLILIAVKLWFLLGLVMAVKRIRWLGTLTIFYSLGYVFSQFVIVWTVVSVIMYLESHAMGWAASGFLYLGMFLFIIGEGLFFVFWPPILKLLSPSSFKYLITLARYV
ncbi:MAG TPA: hypothetical protein HA306_08265 [Methanosarcina sp.]|nr:hypothetical protein [Methanosarcina sp.]